jgi:hypothetical protein
MITSSQKLLMARAGAVPPPEPFDFLGSSTLSVSSSSSFSINRPAHAKDGSVLIIGLRASSANEGITVTPPSGFTTIGYATGGTFSSTGDWCAKKLTSADVGPFSFSTSSAANWNLATVSLAECDLGSDFGVAEFQGSTVPSVTPTENGNLLIFAMFRTNVDITSTTPSTTPLATGTIAYFDVGPSVASTTYGPWDLNTSGRTLSGYLNLVL